MLFHSTIFTTIRRHVGDRCAGYWREFSVKAAESGACIHQAKDSVFLRKLLNSRPHLFYDHEMLFQRYVSRA